MAEQTLKPCPFCGCTDLEMSLAPGRSYVYCESCEAYGPTGSDEEYAAQLWNRRATEWQPMETAPTDGTLILAHDYDTIAIVSWDGVEWYADGICFFSAGWQYLPEIPEVPQ